MKKRVTLIIGLMAVCVAGVIGLQLFWNYQNYRSTIKNFYHDINEALSIAVDRELDARQQVLITRMSHWMNDSSLITITCNTHNRRQKTVFTMRDVHPYNAKEKGISLSINQFKPQLNSITPQAKQYFINHFTNNIVRRDLKKGFIYYYTQRLGDSLEHAFFTSKLNLLNLKQLYRQELNQCNIHSAFALNTKAVNSRRYLTHIVNASLRRPYEKELVKAGFDSPGLYFIRQMKWIVLATLLLISVIVACFAYTTRTLLSQHKLAELKNNFINNMTHELNTPIASIKITVEALNTFSRNPALLKDYLGIISYQTDKLTNLTQQILDINTLVRAKNIKRSPVNLNTLIKKSIAEMAPQLSTCKVELAMDEKSDFTINANSENLLSVFKNITDNALKYNTSACPKLSIRLARQGRHAAVLFADNGPGVPHEYQDDIFEQFFRVPHGNQHDVKGYGLGLSYVKQVMEAHQGQVQVSDNYPSGSIFTLLFPLT
jgi:two-component system phosphate regulon sensor histidine kinase PhoR